MFLNMQVKYAQVEILMVTSNKLVPQVSINQIQIIRLFNVHEIVINKQTSNADLSSLISDSNSGNLLVFRLL